MFDSRGNATTVDIAIWGNSGWNTTTAGNDLHYDYLWTDTGVTANWSLSDLEIGRTYFLYFYGALNATYTANAGIAEGTVSAHITTAAVMTDATPDHGDWLERSHYAVMRVTPTSSSISGTYTSYVPGQQSVLSGLQIQSGLGTLTRFTGGDAGEGLDLSGNIIYAFNLGPGATQTVQGVTFAAAPVGAPPAGITTTTSTHFDYSTANPGGANGADYGAHADDDALETIVNTVWYGANWTFDLAVTPGTQYQLQLILQESHFGNQGISNRNFDVSVETASPSTLTLAVDELVLGQETDGAGPAQSGADFGLVYTYTFTATDSSFRVALADSPNGSDTFAVLGAVTLEELPAAPDPAVTLDGSTSTDSIASNAPVGTLVGTLSMVNTNPAGFAYSLDAGDTTHFDIPGGTSNLVTKTALGAGPYGVKIVGAKGAFSVTNDFEITVTAPVTVDLSNTDMTANAAVGAQVGTLSMANAGSQAGFTYALDPSGDTTHFAVSDTNKLTTAASLAVGSYDIVIKGTNATDGFWVTNGFTIAVAAVDPLPEPVQYWAFDDGSGATAANMIETGNEGTLVNSPAWTTTGLEPKLTSRSDWPSTAALDFETGDNDYVNGGDINLSTSSGSGEATVSMWVCPESLSTDQRLIAWVSAGGTGLGTLRLESGSLEVFTGSAWAPLAPASPLSAGTWYHLAFVWTGNSVQAYVDGVAQSSATADFDFAGGDFGIGARFRDSFGFTFDGKIDDVAIFDVALTPGQVTALANGDAPIADPGPGGLIIIVR